MTATEHRLSVTSDSSYGDSSEESTPPVPHERVLPSVTVGSVVVNKGGTGVLKGNVTNVTVNQYIVTQEDCQPADIRPAVSDLVTDAVKINSNTTKHFTPDDFSILQSTKEGLSSFQKRWCYLIAALVSLSFITLLSTSLFSLSSFRSHSPQPTTTRATPGPTISDEEAAIINYAGGPTILSRDQWLAKPPLDSERNTLPAEMVVVCHTATDICLTTPDCITIIDNVQDFHMSKHWSDIAYNFLIGGDGCVYWGRGFDLIGSHTKGYNNGTLGIAFIGTYVKYIPNERQIEAFHKLIKVGVGLNKLAQNYTLVAQCQLQVTAAPGLALVRSMRSWPHFNSSLPEQCTV